MNRMEEYNALLQELEETPARLNSTVARAKARTRRQKLRRAFGVPASAVAAACVCFVLLVNLSGPFAAACADIPVLSALAEAVSFNPSLSAAVENDWVQPIGLTQSANGVEMTIEYVIVDQKQLNIFYTLEGDPEADYQPDVSVSGMDGEELPCVTTASSCRADGKLYRFTAEFTSAGIMPDELRLECELEIRLSRLESEMVGTFWFDLSFDPRFTAQAIVAELDRWLELDGQRVLLKNVEIYPTHMRVNLEDDPENTAWLCGLNFYAEDEKGTRYDEASDRITAVVSADSPFYESFWLDSSFFSDGEHLTLSITGADWLDKGQEWTWVDLTTGETGFLPDEVSLYSFSREGEDASLTFRVRTGSMNLFNPFLRWRLPGGQEEYFGSYSMKTAVDVDDQGNPVGEAEGCGDVTFTLKGCSGDRVELELNYTRKTVFDSPMEIAIS